MREGTPSTYYEDLVKIPGFGDAPNRCRPMKPVGFCEDGHAVLGRSSCGTRYCPDHWRDWGEEAVINMVARLAAYRESREGWEKRMCHVAASPPQDRRYSVRQLWETRRDAYDVLESAGVRGGAVITHPYRTTPEANRVYEAAEPEVGKWQFLRQLVEDLDGDDWDELERFVEASPHYHALAPVEDVDGSRAPEGWVVENIRSFDSLYVDPEDVPVYELLDENNQIERSAEEVVREGFEDMVGAAYYVLTHGAVQDGRSTTTYFGEVHPNAFNPEEELSAETWGLIQREAERAVKGWAEDEEEGEGHGPSECPVDGCEACVVDIVYLPEYLEDEDFTSRLRTMREGRKRLARLRGMYAWWDDRTDRPPPSVLTSEAKLLDWFEQQGETYTPEPSQVRLGGPVMG
jgi:hypothetical protein